MSSFFYSRLALQNIRKNARSYISYMITCVITITMFYIMSVLTNATDLDQFYGLGEVRGFLAFGQWVIGIFAFIFLFYTHSFIIKRRKKEFGLYNILGMEKRHIAVVLFYETLYCALISLILGIFFGVVLYRAAQLFLIKLVHAQAELASSFSGIAFSTTLILFGILFFLTFLSSLRQIRIASPIELLKGGQVGEKEPKARIFLVILGLLCLGIGYYISITATAPMETIGLFFLAVVLVIIGTYCLFTAVTIAVLKLLRKNKKYYYKPNHFTFVSGMLYRMKQNAVGLANICVLSTMVLVMMSTCLMLYVSIGDLIRTAYPRNIEIQVNRPDTGSIDDLESSLDKLIEQENITPKNLQRFYEAYLIFNQKDNHFSESDVNYVYENTNASVINFMTLEHFNRLAGTDYTLENPQEVYLYAYSTKFDYSTIEIENMTFNIKGMVEDVEDIADGPVKGMAKTYYMIVKDMDTLTEITDSMAENMAYGIATYYYSFDLDIPGEEQIALRDRLANSLLQEEAPLCPNGVSVSSSVDASASYYQLYGGLLFIGVFLGILFLMATVLIIYYKQITEGYEDQARFEIMQNVGMSRREVKSTIKSQVLSVFYLPLGLACVHTAFAYPIVSRLLKLLQMTNPVLFFWGMMATIGVFAVFYTIIYVLTARIYYKIVSAKSSK